MWIEMIDCLKMLRGLLLKVTPLPLRGLAIRMEQSVRTDRYSAVAMLESMSKQDYIHKIGNMMSNATTD